VLERVRGVRQLRARRRIGEWGPTTTNNSRRTTPAVKPRPKVNPSPRTNRVPTNTQFLSYQMTDNFTSGQTQPPVRFSSFHSQSRSFTKLLQISQHADNPLTISSSKITRYHGSPFFFFASNTVRPLVLTPILRYYHRHSYLLPPSSPFLAPSSYVSWP